MGEMPIAHLLYTVPCALRLCVDENVKGVRHVEVETCVSTEWIALRTHLATICNVSLGPHIRRHMCLGKIFREVEISIGRRVPTSKLVAHMTEHLVRILIHVLELVIWRPVLKFEHAVILSL